MFRCSIETFTHPIPLHKFSDAAELTLIKTPQLYRKYPQLLVAFGDAFQVHSIESEIEERGMVRTKINID